MTSTFAPEGGDPPRWPGVVAHCGAAARAVDFAFLTRSTATSDTTGPRARAIRHRGEVPCRAPGAGRPL
ncbi:hypothetical protein [Streptomyces hygroscopicus]|uniref:hypothetical protein n=1 Tax=Streptomyces hygroscopicus TaxID=1912 RepID=UPI0037AC04D2